MPTHQPVHRCWACTIGREVPPRYTNPGTIARTLGRFALYEHVVEYLESLPAGTVIRRPEVVRALGPGPAMFGMVQLVVQDMVLHGLLVCVHRGRTGNCYAFEFKKGLRT